MNKRLVLLSAAALAASAQASAPLVTERTFYAMGTSLEMTLAGIGRTDALKASEAAFRSVQATENRLSTWTPQSELSKLNQAPVGQKQKLSPLLERDLRGATRCAENLGYAFDPWVGPLVRAWGLKSGGKVPAVAEREQARLASQADAFEWSGHALVKRRAGAAVEEGGFGKGVGLDDAIQSLSESGVRSAVLSFGGQIAVMGPGPVPIEIADPSDRSRTLARFRMGEGSVSTSGNSEHGFQVRDRHGTRKYGHLLDSRTGAPAAFEGSATVIASSGAEADCLSKVFVLGPEAGLRWAAERHAQVLWVQPGMKAGQWVLKTSCDWREKIEAVAPGVEVESGCEQAGKS